MLDVTTASSDRYLTTTAAVKLLLGTTATSDDSLISDLILRASHWAESYVGYPLSAQKYLETIPAYGTRRLMLARTPVIAVSGLFHGTDSGDYTQAETSEFALDREAGFIERGIGWSWSVPVSPDLSLAPRPGEEYPDWRVEYVAGWTRGGIDTGSSIWSTEKGTTSTARTLPQDIEDAVIVKTIDWYESGENVLEKQVGDLRIRYGSFGTPMDPITKDRAAMKLAPYRRLV